ncbi:putative galacturonosyltransferase 6 isoform X1 [Capsicum annuum]|uniref:probable galacturonosyltransferase 6 isoform X1 n=1 Tax=Capsicum annuum TaxID=4072 RepID=UPI001FB14C4E|nr:probable galacturonosyltransferase 6 isoform X1 [Capsicum annuum]
MRLFRRCTRISILSLLAISVFTPVFLLSYRLKNLNSNASRDFVEDLSILRNKYLTVSFNFWGGSDSRLQKHRVDAQANSAVQQEEVEDLKGPHLVVYRDGDHGSLVSLNENDSLDKAENVNSLQNNGTTYGGDRKNQQNLYEKRVSSSSEKEKSRPKGVQHSRSIQSHPQRPLDEKVKEMKDKVIRAKAYLSFTPPGSNSHFVKEIKLRIKELERAVGGVTKDSRLSRRAMQKMKAMEGTLLRASRIYPDCSAMVNTLRAMTYNAEEQLRSQRDHTSFLVQLAARTTPKGLHCLSMRLTAEYFALQPEERELPNQNKLQDPDLYHFAVFSDNVLACSVVVNSTVSTARDPEKIVFHIVTDSLNLPAMSMWFLMNPPGKATVQIQSVDSFEWLSTKYNEDQQKQKGLDPRYTSVLNHLRFYLPDIFPSVNKIVFLDHDVVVKKDLTRLWRINIKGKANGAVETCVEGEPSFRRMDMFINFTDPSVATRFDSNTCTWAFGMNVFDLHEWRKRNLTARYHKYLDLGSKRPLLKAGSLPIGWMTFYNHTHALDRTWHLLGLGYDSGVTRAQIEQAAVVHYDGVMKPWLDIGIHKYKSYWNKHVSYEHPYLQQCNLHQ